MPGVRFFRSYGLLSLALLHADPSEGAVHLTRKMGWQTYDAGKNQNDNTMPYTLFIIVFSYG